VKKGLIASAAFMLALPAIGAVARLPAPREAEFGTRSIIYDLALLQSATVRKVREHCAYCGDEGGDIETAIGLLGIGGRATMQSLLNLLSVRLDAAGAEERGCQIAKRGKSVIPALKQLSATETSSWCHQTFHDLRKRELANLPDVTAEQVCRPAVEVEADRKEWLAAFQSGRNLLAESGPC
jgi:hypothetical protein